MSAPVRFRFCLFVADDSPNGAQATANLAAICAEYLPGRHTIEIVDVFKVPARALEANVFMTPTLILLSPAPVRRIVGTLSQTEVVLRALGITKQAA